MANKTQKNAKMQAAKAKKPVKQAEPIRRPKAIKQEIKTVRNLGNTAAAARNKTGNPLYRERTDLKRPLTNYQKSRIAELRKERQGATKAWGNYRTQRKEAKAAGTTMPIRPDQPNMKRARVGKGGVVSAPPLMAMQQRTAPLGGPRVFGMGATKPNVRK